MFTLADVNTYRKLFLSVLSLVYIHTGKFYTYIAVSVCTCTSRILKTDNNIAIEIICSFSCGLFQNDSDEEDDMPAAKTLAPSKVSFVKVKQYLRSVMSIF